MKQELIKVAIVEDNAGLRRTVEMLLRRHPEVQLVGAFPDGEQAVRELPALQPRIVLMDINLPGMDGVECVERLSRVMPEVQVIMLTVYDDTDAIFNSLAAGACGYLLKPVRATQLIGAIKEAVAGGSPMTSNIARRVVQAFKKPAAAGDDKARLAPREQEIIELLAKGLMQKEIAEKLGVSYWTVQTHIARIYEKLHVHSRAQAVAKFHGRLH
jgi:DNA-binding NarL/FixJ family response regulator